MKSTFKVLFYVKKQSVKNGKAPVMGRITINGTQWKSHATLTLLATQDCPLWLQYDCPFWPKSH